MGFTKGNEKPAQAGNFSGTREMNIKRALRMVRPQLKGLGEKLFPRTMYARRYRSWLMLEPELALLPALCRRDAVAIDIGANEGFFAKHLLPLAQSVIAFEPLPQLVAELRKNYPDKMEIHGIILSDHEGDGELRFPAGGFMSATVQESNHAAAESGRAIETVVVAMKTLDGFHLTNVGFIKIDVEGHEEAVLRGGLTTIKREMPNLMIEIEERHAPGSLDRVPALLADAGYCGYYLDGDSLRPLWQFNPLRDQVKSKGRQQRYINNFLFFPRERADSILEAARKYLPGSR